MSEHTDFEHTVSPRRHSSTTPFTVELTCTEVRRRKILYSNGVTTSSPSLPDKSTVRHSCSIPLEKSNDVAVEIARGPPNGTTVISRSSKLTNFYSLNCVKNIWQVMRLFGVTIYGCATILADIKKTIRLLGDSGVIEVKIWKIITKVYRIYALTMEYCSDPTTSEENNNNECVICMEAFKQREMVCRLPCDHRFHGYCIFEWKKTSHQCPLCRFLFYRR